MKADLIGLILGDGHLKNNGQLTIIHSEKQYEYLKFIKEKIDEIYPNKNINICKVSNQDAYRIYLSDSSYFKQLWELIYSNNGKKYYTSEVLECLTEQAIAFWFCDDGSMYYKKRDGIPHAIDSVIATCCSEEEVHILINYFQNNWGIKCTKKREKNNLFSIRTGTKGSKKFIDIFGLYIPDCMLYKKDKVLNFKSNFNFKCVGSPTGRRQVT